MHGELQIMRPMIAAVGERRDAKAQIEAVRQELLREGKPVAEKIPIGIMIETPAAALAADRLAQECDFFSIGTNDLIQYSLAIDRSNRDVAYLYRPLHLGVLRLIQASVEGAQAAGIECAMCGEMAGDPAYVLVLLALGLDTLSMNPADIPKVKRVIRAADVGDARKMLDEEMAFSSHDEILDECLRQYKSSRVALETAVKTGLVILIGEITTRARLEYSNIVRRTVERIGFNDGSMGFDARSCAVMVAVEQQSPEIAMG